MLSVLKSGFYRVFVIFNWNDILKNLVLVLYFLNVSVFNFVNLVCKHEKDDWIVCRTDCLCCILCALVAPPVSTGKDIFGNASAEFPSRDSGILSGKEKPPHRWKAMPGQKLQDLGRRKSGPCILLAPRNSLAGSFGNEITGKCFSGRAMIRLFGNRHRHCESFLMKM